MKDVWVYIMLGTLTLSVVVQVGRALDYRWAYPTRGPSIFDALINAAMIFWGLTLWL